MADTKLTALTGDTAPGLDSLIYTVDDPAGTPASRKTVISEMLITLGLLHGAGEISITGAVTATIGKMHVCSGTTADYTVTLPAVSGNAGKLIGFRMATGLTKLVTLDGNASELIDGVATRIMWAGESALLLCDGSNWFKIAGKSIPMIARMYLSADQTGLADATFTKVTLDTSIVDNSALMVDTTNRRIVARRAGLYLPGASLSFGFTTPSAIACNIKVLNTTDYANIFFAVVSSSSSATLPLSKGPVQFAVSDYVELFGYVSAASARLFFSGAKFTWLSLEELSQW